MSNEQNSNPSAIDHAGSGKDLGSDAPRQSESNSINYEEVAKNLERKLGEQGRELGEYRKFFEEISPILEPLDRSPNMVRAIVNEKLNDSVALAAIEDRLVINEEIVSKAHDDVKKQMGKKAYGEASSESIEKMVTEKIKEETNKVMETIKENEELRSFEKRTVDFIERTPDFADLSEDIDKWLSDHPEISDIEIAYHAVKGALSVKDASEKAEEEAAERAKEIALNAAGGSSKANFIGSDKQDVIDSLISPKSNPNIF